eukprot:TRINITY_DN41215_c0_g1_i1.p1 TRINITY_DN41215_c0_g1~~TRINITY_DN41215_c0_g1_i1.p1  ORF type:complete len:319 (-),score=44.38 TRINITY_DN41215_c0_g1_i1:56-1012(-)
MGACECKCESHTHRADDATEVEAITDIKFVFAIEDPLTSEVLEAGGDCSTRAGSDISQTSLEEMSSVGDVATHGKVAKRLPEQELHASEALENTEGWQDKDEVCSDSDGDDGMPPDFGDPQFWKEVYSHKRSRKHIPQEWIVAYKDFKAQRWHRFLRGGNILDLGCGDSSFMSDAHDDGIRDITCTDIEPSVIETMRRRNAQARPDIKYSVCDARNMHMFADGSFDIIFEKGTLDALKCAGRVATSQCSSEIHRVLKNTGLYICVSLQECETTVRAIRDTGCVSRQWSVQTLAHKTEADDAWPDDMFVHISKKIPLRR